MKKTQGRTTATKERYWTKIIIEARDYPDGVAAYCADKNIFKNTYYYWFKQLRVKHPEWTDLNSHPSHRNGSMNETETRPETEVIEKAVRRTFTESYKKKILKEVDVAAPGTVAAILRREGLYSSHLQKWRDETKPQKRGPKTNPLTAEVKKLRAEKARLQKQLDQANNIIDLQKKISEILGVTLEEIPEDEQPKE
ncbi:MAG: transposase [Nitrososphaera sp.]|nr:transposase [Nitrososphaera sp.]